MRGRKDGKTVICRPAGGGRAGAGRFWRRCVHGGRCFFEEKVPEETGALRRDVIIQLHRMALPMQELGPEAIECRLVQRKSICGKQEYSAQKTYTMQRERQ